MVIVHWTQKEESMTTSHRESKSFFKDLAALLTGHLIVPEDAAYEQVSRLWNGRVTTRPAALVPCADIQDVIHAVRWARSHGLALSVLCDRDPSLSWGRQSCVRVKDRLCTTPWSSDGWNRCGLGATVVGRGPETCAVGAGRLAYTCAVCPERGYIGLLDEGEQERVPLTFGANYERLLELKRTYDPNDVFHSTIGHIPPRSS